jgi:4-carboxymuconolactone decarboxylase
MEYHVPQARKAGLNDVQISEAIRLADRVRQVPARKVLDVALQLLTTDRTSIETQQSETAEPKQTGTTVKSC